MAAECNNKAQKKIILVRLRKREVGVDFCFYLRSIVVSIRATHRRGRSDWTRLAAVFMGLQLPWLLDSEYEGKKEGFKSSLQKMVSLIS